jgi:hypothetical protein
LKSTSAEKLRKVLEHLEAERLGRSFNLPKTVDAATVGRWLAWITPQMRAAMSRAASPSPTNHDDALTAAEKEVNANVEHEPERADGGSGAD